MAASTHTYREDLHHKRGATFGRRWPITTSTGQPVDFTGWTAIAQVRADYGSDVLHEWSTADGTISLADSAVALTATAATTSAWTWHSARYDVKLVAPDGRVKYIVEGTLLVHPRVTP